MTKPKYSRTYFSNKKLRYWESLSFRSELFMKTHSKNEQKINERKIENLSELSRDTQNSDKYII